MNSSIWLTVEFSPGSDISNACRDAVALAGKLDVAVHAPFNGVMLMAHKGDDPAALERSWRKELESKHSYKIATAQRGMRHD